MTITLENFKAALEQRSRSNLARYSCPLYQALSEAGYNVDKVNSTHAVIDGKDYTFTDRMSAIVAKYDCNLLMEESFPVSFEVDHERRMIL